MGSNSSPLRLCFLSKLCSAEWRCTPSGPDHHKHDDHFVRDDHDDEHYDHGDKQDNHDKQDDYGNNQGAHEKQDDHDSGDNHDDCDEYDDIVIKMMVMWMTIFDHCNNNGSYVSFVMIKIDMVAKRDMIMS